MKKPITALLALATLTLTASAPLEVERYEFDKSHTNIGFVVRHLAVTNVRGKFNEFDGEIVLDTKDVTKSTVRVRIDAKSVDTDNQRRDDHLRSEDFFEVAKFPNITFVSNRIEKKGDQLIAHGELTIRDVTRQVSIPFELAGPVNVGRGQKKIGAEGMLTVNRFDYGLKWNRMTEAVQVVAPEIRIELQVEAQTPREATQ